MLSAEENSISLDQLSFKKISPDLGLASFDCQDTELNEFLTQKALDYQKSNLANTTCIYYDGKFVAYFSTCMDSIALTDGEKGIFHPNKRIIKSYPAIKLARMATIPEYQRRGIGSIIVDLVVGMAFTSNQQGLACRYVIVDAYPSKEDWYTKRGFIRNQIKANKGDTISMRRDIFAE